MRIQKAITESGFASRREAERLIIEGHVQVNNETVYHPNTAVDIKKDTILIDGQPLPSPERKVYYAYHKPKGVICSRQDPQNRPSVYDHLDILPYRIESIGRLDFNTSGLLLFTNDGTLAHSLTHPKFDIPKKYRVKVWKKPDERQLNRLRKGITLDDGRTKPAKVRIIDTTDTDNTWLEITLTEGKNRLIRRMFEAINHPVSKLKRVSFAGIGIGKLDVKKYRPLTGIEVDRLRAVAAGEDPKKIKKFKYKKGFARPKIKNSPLRKKRKK